METAATRYAEAFVRDWEWYYGTAPVEVTGVDREMILAAVSDLLCEAEFIELVRGLP